jgi:mono/diheme cytochrome c family protein
MEPSFKDRCMHHPRKKFHGIIGIFRVICKIREASVGIMNFVPAILLLWIPIASPQSSDQGRKVYEKACLECHGPAGRGDGPKAKKLGFRPRDLSLGAFKCRCTASGQLPTDEDLFRVISNGMPGTPMPAHEKALSVEDRQAVIQYIKSLTPGFSAGAAPQCITIPAAPPRTEQSVFEGRQVYRILGCGKCHGKAGKGDGPASRGLKDDWGQPIRAYNFTASNRLKCGGEDAAIYRVLHTGMNGSPMPSFEAAFAFARESAPLDSLKADLTAAELQELTSYVDAQPDAATLKGLTSEARRALIDRRTWALVHYLRSLVVSR